MSLRTVRLNQDEEATLKRVRAATGLTVSAALKRGLRALQRELEPAPAPAPSFWEVYSQLPRQGRGGHSLGPAARAKAVVREAILSRHREHRDAAKREAGAGRADGAVHP